MTEEERVSTLLAEYESEAKTYEAFCERVEHLLNELLEISEIKISAVTSRLKARSSFEDKIRADKKYLSITDVTDVAGARVVTFFADDVDRVDELIRDEFDIDIVNLLDKRAALRSDQFGYQSLHLVTSLNERRLTQPELQRFAGLKIEIQVRSLLQHAWAEIEHGSYKPKRPIPASVRRSFSRVAGLLELADKEFVASREDLVSVSNGPQLCRAEGITELVPPFDVEIPFAALRVNTSPPNNALVLFVNANITNRLFFNRETEVRMEIVDGAAHLGTAVGVARGANNMEFKNVLPMCPPPKGEFIRTRVSGLRVDASTPYAIAGSSSEVVQARWAFTPVPGAKDENEHFLTTWQDIAIPKPSLGFEAKSLGPTELLVTWYKGLPYKQIALKVTFRGLIPKAFRTRAQERLGCRMTPRATRLALRIFVPPGSRVFATLGELLQPPNEASFRLMMTVNALGDGEVRFMNPAFAGTIDDVHSEFAELQVQYGGRAITAWECCRSVQSDQVVSFGLVLVVPDGVKLDGISASGFYAPLSTNTKASQHESIPRFTDPSEGILFDGLPS